MCSSCASGQFNLHSTFATVHYSQKWVGLSLSSICCITSALGSAENKTDENNDCEITQGDFQGKWIHFQTHNGYRLGDSDLDIKAKTNMLNPQSQTSEELLQTVSSLFLCCLKRQWNALLLKYSCKCPKEWKQHLIDKIGIFKNEQRS